MVLPITKCWITLSVGYSPSMAMSFQGNTHKYFKKLLYLLNIFPKLQTWLVEVVHLVNSMTAPYGIRYYGAH